MISRTLLILLLGFVCWRETHPKLIHQAFIWTASDSVGEVHMIDEPRRIVVCPPEPGNMAYDRPINWTAECWRADKQAFVRYSIKEQ